MGMISNDAITKPARTHTRSRWVDDGLDGIALHRAVAEALCVRQKWPTDLVGGGLPNGDYAFCFAPTPMGVAEQTPELLDEEYDKHFPTDDDDEDTE